MKVNLGLLTFIQGAFEHKEPCPLPGSLEQHQSQYYEKEVEFVFLFLFWSH